MRVLLLLFPAQVIFALCRPCQLEMDVTIHSLAYDSIEMARKKGLFCPKGCFAHPSWVSDYLKYCNRYSEYRKKFHYLLRSAEDSYAEMYRDLKEEIQEIEGKLVSLHSRDRPDTKSIEHYEYFLKQYTSVLKEEITVLYLAQGLCYSDLGLYNQAIEALTEAIRIHPENKEAYLERAAAFFEMGNFENSIEDFLSSGYHTTPIDSSLFDYAGGFIIGASNGFQEALTQFVPGLLNSAKGLSSAIWSLAIHPAQFSTDVCKACLSFTKFLITHSKPEILEAISPKLKTLVFDSDTLSMHEKGEYLGSLISKNGVELFGMVGAMKIAREMRRANMIMTLETLATSKPKVLEKSIAWGEKHLDEINKIKTDEAFIKSLKNQNLSESTIRKTIHELGYKTFSRPKGLPENYVAKFSDKKVGMKYVDSNNPHNYVRVMPGNPTGPNQWQHKPYVQHVRDGDYLDKFGNHFDSRGVKYTRESKEVHILLEEFRFYNKVDLS